MPSEHPLTLEQKLKVQMFEMQTQNMSREQAQQFLLDLFRQMMVKENLMQKMLSNTPA